MWWVFDRGTIAEVFAPMRGKGEEEESNTCSTWGDCSRLAVGAWLAGDDAAPVEGEMSMVVAGESIEEKELGPTIKGEKKRVWTDEGSDTKLRKNGRFNLIVSQPFLYI